MKRRVVVALLFALTASLLSLQDCPAQVPSSGKVVLIFDISGRGDGGFNDSAYRGLERAVAEFGVQAEYVEHKRNLDRDNALKKAAVSDAGLIIGVGFAFSDKMNELADSYPDKKFVCIDYSVRYDDKGNSKPLPSNFYGITFREEEGSYLVGAIAALTSKTGQIGFIGGMDNDIIRKFQGGYIAGATAIRPDIRIVSKFAGITGRAFNDPRKGRQLATEMYNEGVDIIYHAAGLTGAGLFQAAKEMKKMVIGVDIDQSAQAPGLVLTSMVKNIDVALFESVRAYVRGYFSGGLKTFGLAKNGVGFVYNDQNSQLMTAEIYDRAMALRKKIIDGKLAVPAESSHRSTISEKELQEVLYCLKQDIAESLNKLDQDIKTGARTLSGKSLKDSLARDVLKQLYTSNNYIIDCETVNDKGVMLVVEPPLHKAAEGADISSQAHMIKLFKTRKPVMSNSFRSVEGPAAVVIHHPVFSTKQRFMGSVAALFAPEYMLPAVIGPVSSNLPVDIFLMQKDGLMIYDLDTKQIGLNVFSDPLYKPFPQLRSLAKKVAAKREGIGSYLFYRDSKSKPVKKVAYWKTVALHGTEWRLVITCSEDSVR